jgi:hypothetical protein
MIDHGFTFANTMAVHFIASLIHIVLAFAPIYRKDGKWVWLRNMIFYGIPDQVRPALAVGVVF